MGFDCKECKERELWCFESLEQVCWDCYKKNHWDDDTETQKVVKRMHEYGQKDHLILHMVQHMEETGAIELDGGWLE